MFLNCLAYSSKFYHLGLLEIHFDTLGISLLIEYIEAPDSILDTL